jgi:hypothetical protein
MAFNQGASSGNLVLIEKQTASASASITFTTGITGYDEYVLTYIGVTCSDAAINILIQFSTNGGATYDASALYSVSGYVSLSIGITSQHVPSGTFANIGSVSFDPGVGACGQVNLYNLNSSTLNKTLTCSYVGYSAAFGTGGGNLQGIYANNTVVNAFQVFPATGTITTGTFKLYGVAN